MNRLAVVIAIAGFVVARPDPAVAQSRPDRVEVGVQVSSAISSQFDRTDLGLGGRLSWHPIGLIGILIFPPPLSCELASGRTLLAFDIGGGVEMFATRQTFVRVGVGDRLLKYPGPVFDNTRAKREDAFFSHDFRFAAGAGLRF